jgi:rhamnosyltransferase
MKIACIIPTFNAGQDLPRLILSLSTQTVSPDIYIVDSSSTDGTVQIARDLVGNVVVIPQSAFNHGGTRQMMIDRFPDYDVYVFMTQDAYLHDEEALSNLLAPFYNSIVGAVCGRQVPHGGASLLAQHARIFNYPDDVCIKTMDDLKYLGIKTAFMSNSFSAYRKIAIEKVGGFPTHVILSEDMYVAAKLLMAGWHLVYAGNAKCFHSHNYSMHEEFSRYFDIGVFHAREPWIQQTFGGARGEGLRFVKSELFFLGFKAIYLWPNSILRNIVKFVGYKLGCNEHRLSVGIKRSLSMNKNYWRSPPN